MSLSAIGRFYTSDAFRGTTWPAQISGTATGTVTSTPCTPTDPTIIYEAFIVTGSDGELYPEDGTKRFSMATHLNTSSSYGTCTIKSGSTDKTSNFTVNRTIEYKSYEYDDEDYFTFGSPIVVVKYTITPESAATTGNYTFSVTGTTLKEYDGSSEAWATYTANSANVTLQVSNDRVPSWDIYDSGESQIIANTTQNMTYGNTFTFKLYAPDAEEEFSENDFTLTSGTTSVVANSGITFNPSTRTGTIQALKSGTSVITITSTSRAGVGYTSKTRTFTISVGLATPNWSTDKTSLTISTTASGTITITNYSSWSSLLTFSAVADNFGGSVPITVSRSGATVTVSGTQVGSNIVKISTAAVSGKYAAKTINVMVSIRAVVPHTAPQVFMDRRLTVYDDTAKNPISGKIAETTSSPGASVAHPGSCSYGTIYYALGTCVQDDTSQPVAPASTVVGVTTMPTFVNAGPYYLYYRIAVNSSYAGQYDPLPWTRVLRDDDESSLLGRQKCFWNYTRQVDVQKKSTAVTTFKVGAIPTAATFISGNNLETVPGANGANYNAKDPILPGHTPTYTLTNWPASSAAAGTYTVTPGISQIKDANGNRVDLVTGVTDVNLTGQSHQNYGITGKAFTVTVLAAGNITFNPANLTGTYSGSSQTVTVTAATNTTGQTISYTLNGVKNSGGTAVTGWSLSGRTLTIPASTAVGSYTVTVTATSARSSTYYEASIQKSFTVTIGRIKLTKPTISNASKTYNAAAQSPTISGYSSSTMTQSGTTSATNAGSYAAKYDIKDTTNYEWADGTQTQVSLAWTIAKYNLSNATIAALSAQTYNGSAKTPTSTVTVPIPSGSSTTITTTDFDWSYSNNTNAGTATATITAKSSSTNYTGSKSANFTINKAGITSIAAPSANNKTYNRSAQNIVTNGTTAGGSYTYSVVNKGSAAGTYYAYDNANMKKTNAGNYTVYWKFTADSNHTINSGVTSSGNFDASIAQATLTLTWSSPATKAYDGTALATTAQISGVISGDTCTVATTANSIGPNVTASTTVTASISGASSANYKLPSTTTKSYSITAKPITVAAVAKSKTYGGSDPTLQFTFGGTTYNSGASINTGVGTEKLTVTLSRKSGEGAGTYTISGTAAAGSGTTLSNYSFSCTTANFTINKAGIASIVAPTANNKTYNGAAQNIVTNGTTAGGSYTYSVVNSGASAGTYYAYDNANMKKTNAGNYTVYWKFTADGNHTINSGVTSSGSFAASISKATLTGTVSSHTVTYGAAKPTLTISYSGFKGSDTQATVVTTAPTLSTTYTSSTAVASSPVATTASGGAVNSNYTLSIVNGAITINKASVTVTAPTANTLTYNAAAQTLCTTGSGSGGTFKYGTSSASSTTRPTGTNAGEYTVYWSWTADANHTTSSTTSGNFKVTIAKYNLSNATIGTIATQKYSGSAVTPTATVTVPIPSGSTTTLTTTDFTWSYTNNTAPGTGTATITAKSTSTNYTGTKSKTFTIENQTYSVTYNKGDATSGTAPAAQTKTYGTNLTLQTNSGNLAHSQTTGTNNKTDQKITLKYNVNGGSSTAPSDTVGTGVTIPGSYPITWTAAGWGTSSGTTTKAYDFGGTKTSNSAETLYPAWSKSNGTTTYTATSASATVTSTVPTKNNVDANVTITVTYDANGGTASTVPSASTGTAVNTTPYTFSKWAAGSTSGTQYATGATYSENITASKSVTMYAIWTAGTTTRKSNPSITLSTTTPTRANGSGSTSKNIALTLNYNANGGTGTTASNTGTAVSCPGTYPITYTFNGWNSNTAGTGTNYTAGTAYTFSANTKIYAKWTGTNGTTTWTGKSISANTASNSFTKTGYTFSGWNTKADGTGTAYAAGATVTQTGKTDNSSLTLYAQWTANNYTLTVYPKGGTYAGSTSTTTHTQAYGTSIDLTNPTKTGWTFAGWRFNPASNAPNSKFADPIFESGTDSTGKYSNSGTATYTVTRVQDNTVPVVDYGASATGYKLVFNRSTGTSSPNCGGFMHTVASAANKKFRHVFLAKIPVGYYLQVNKNATGDGSTSTWVTSSSGTGNWTWYAYDLQCGSTGTFGTFGYISLVAEDGDSTKAITYELALNQITDITNSTAAVTYNFNTTSNGTAEAIYAANNPTFSPANQSTTYIETARTYTVPAASGGVGGTFTYRLENASDKLSFNASTRVLTLAAGAPVGTYTGYLVVDSGSIGVKSVKFTWTVAKRTVTATMPTIATGGQWDNAAHDTTTGGSVSSAGATMYYYQSTTNTTPTFSTSTWTTTRPTAKDIGTYYVWAYAYVSDTTNNTASTNTNTVKSIGSYTISKRTVTLTWGTTEWTYTGTAHSTTCIAEGLAGETARSGLGNNCYNGATGKYNYGTTTDIYKTTGTFQGKSCTKVYMGTAGLACYPYVWIDGITPSPDGYTTTTLDVYFTSQTSLIFYTYSTSGTTTWKNLTTCQSGTGANSTTIPITPNQWNTISITIKNTGTGTAGFGYMRIGSGNHTSTTDEYWLFSNIRVSQDTCDVTLSGNSITNVGTTTVTATALSNSNYQLPSAKTATLKVNAVALKSIAKPANTTYNGSAQTPTPAVVATVNGTDKTLVKDTDYTLSYSNNTNAGTATVTATGKGNYTGTVSNTWTIGVLSLTVPTVNTNPTYNGTTAVSPTWNSYNTSYMTIGGTTSKASATTCGSGTTYTATFTLKSTTNTKWADGTTAAKSVTWYINKRAITITGASATKDTYDGTAVTSNSSSLTSGTLGTGDTGTYTATGSQTNVGSSNNVPNVVIKNSGGTDVTSGCYTVTKVNGTLKVTNPATGTITYSPANKSTTYGDTSVATTAASGNTGTLSYSLTSVKNSGGTAVSGFSLSGTTLTIPAKQAAGTYTVTIKATSAATTNYTAVSSEKSFTLTIGQKEVGLTWSTPTTKAYDGTALSISATATGLLSGDTCTVTVSPTSIGPAPTASTTATATGLSNANYKLPSAKTQAYSITALTLTVTAVPYSGTYDGAAHKAAVKVNIAGATVKSGTASGTYGTTDTTSTTANTAVDLGAASRTNAGTTTVYYQVSKTGYTTVTGSTTITIAKRAVTLTAANASKKYNENNPTLTSSITSTTKLVNANDLGTLGATTTATKTSNVGTYAITPTYTANDNYTVTTQNGTLTIGQADSSITLSSTGATINTGATCDVSSYVSGTVPTGVTLTYAITTNGTTTASTISGSTVTAGAMSSANDNNQTVVVTITNPGNTNYASSTKTFTITVQKLQRTLTFNNTTSSVTYGSTLSVAATASPTATISYSTTGTYTSLSGSTLTGNKYSGTSTDTITASVARTTTYAAKSITRTVKVTQRAITVTADSAEKVYDGTALTKNSGSITTGTLASWDTATITATGSQTNVGSSNNVPTTVIKNGTTVNTSNYAITSVNGTLKVTQRTVTFGTPSAVSGTLTYSGSAQKLFNAGTAASAGGTLYYKVTTSSTKPSYDNTWTTTIPNQTNAGTYYVWYYCKVDDTTNNTGTNINTVLPASGTISKVIGKATVTAPNTTEESLPYTGSAQSPTYTASKTGMTTGGTTSATNVGDYTITYTLTSTSNYQWDDGTTDAKSKTWHITKVQTPFTLTQNASTEYTTTTLDLSAYVNGAVGTVTYTIKTNGTTTASTISGSKVTLGAMSTANDTNQTVVVTIKDPGNSNYSAKAIDYTITVQKYTPTINFNNTTASVNMGNTLSVAATATVAGGTAGTFTYALDKTTYATISGSTVTGVKYSGTTTTTVTASLSRTATVKAGSKTRTFTVTDATAPTPAISGGTTAKATSQTVTLTATDENGSGVSKYYWGTSSTGTPSTAWDGTATTKTVALADVTSSATYYLRVQDASGNIGTTSITFVRYTVNNLLETAAGAAGTYTSANYTSASSTSYVVKQGTSLALSGIYTNPSSTYCTFKGESTTYGTTAATLATANVSAANTTYYMWFDRDHVTVPTISGKSSFEYSGTAQGITVNLPSCDHSGTHYTESGTKSETNVGNYAATYTLKSTAYQKWSDKTTAAKNLNWSITKATLTVTASSHTVSYGDAKPTLSYTITGFKNSETEAVLTTKPTVSTTYTSTTDVASSPVATVASGAAAANYSFNYVNGAITINRKKLTIPTAKTGLVYSGLSMSGVLNAPTEAQATRTGNANGTNAGNYSVSYTPTANYQWSDGTTTAKTVNWSIAAATLTKPTISNASKTYTGTSQSPTITGYDSSTMTESGTKSATNAGDYEVVYAITDKTNYTWADGTTTNVSLNWSIAAIVITITATAQSKTYDGSALTAANTATVTSGTLISGQTIAVTCSGSVGPDVGSATKTLATAKVMSGTTDVSANYTITKVNSTLTITQAEIATVDPSTAANKTYNKNAQSIVTNGSTTGGSYSYSASASGTYTSGYTKTNADTYTVYWKFTPDANHKLKSGITSSGNFNATISPKTVGLTWSTPTTKTYDGTVLATTATATGIISGDTCTVTTSVTSIGPNVTAATTVTALSLSNSNYALPAAKTQSYSITPRAITVTATDQSKSYDGTKLVADNTASVTSTTQLVSGHTLSVTGCTGEVGPGIGTATKVLGTVKVMSGSTDVSGNYSITKVNGTLEITVPTDTGAFVWSNGKWNTIKQIYVYHDGAWRLAVYNIRNGSSWKSKS